MKNILIYAFLILSPLFSQNYSHALKFDGFHDYVNLGRPVTMYDYDDATVSLWINAADIESESYLLSNDTTPANPQFSLSMDHEGRIKLRGEGFEVLTEQSYDDGIWHHIVGVKENGCLTLYVDNIQYPYNCGINSMDHGADFFLGAHRPDGDQYAFKGFITGVSFYDTNLSPEEIQQIYFGTGSPSNLVSSYDFEYGEGNNLYDTYGTYDGTFFGSPIWVDMPLQYGCTDEFACNYNDSASVDDGSCFNFDLCGVECGNNTTCLIIEDVDGNLYGTVNIGSQQWTRQNLKVTTYENGDPINFIDNSQWGSSSGNPENESPAYTDVSDELDYDFGLYYNGWAAQDNRNICMEGWSVPEWSDFEQLIEELGGSSQAGAKLRSEEIWNTSDVNTNESGFSALPFGTVNEYYGYIEHIGSSAFFYSNTSSTGLNRISMRLDDNGDPYQYHLNGYAGYSVRCVRDLQGCTDQYSCNYNEDAIVDDGSCEFTSCNIENNATIFNGSSSYIDGFDNSFHILDNLTIEFEIIAQSPSPLNSQGENLDEWMGIVTHVVGGESSSTNAAYALEIHPNGNLNYAHEYGSGSNLEFQSINLRDGKKHHIVISRNVSTQEIRVWDNGDLVNVEYYNQDQNPSGGQDGFLRIGATQDLSNLNGVLDNIKIYNKAVENLNYDDEDLVAHWDFNSGFGNVLVDVSGNGHHGSINDGEWVNIDNLCHDPLGCNYFNESECSYDCYTNEELSASVQGGSHIILTDVENNRGVPSGDFSKTYPKGDFSISVEVKPDMQNSDFWSMIYSSSIRSSGNLEYWFGYNENGDVRLHLDGNQNDGQNAWVDFYVGLEDLKWQHLVIVWDEESPKLYLNNEMYEGSMSGGTLSSVYDDMDLSVMFLCLDDICGDENRLAGNVDNFIMWDRAISSEEVNSLYNRNGVINNQELLVEYRFNSTEPLLVDGSIQDYFIDRSGNQNHGDNFSVETINEQATVGCSDESACNVDSDMGNESCFYSEDYGWCDCDGNLPDQCGECYGDNSCLSSQISNTQQLSFDGDGDYAIKLYDPAFEYYRSFRPASTDWHNNWSLDFEISIDLEEMGVGTDEFEGAQIFGKGYPINDDACSIPSMISIYLEDGNSGKITFAVYERNSTASFGIQADAFDIFPNSEYVNFSATFEDIDYYPGMPWGGSHHDIALKLFANGQEIAITDSWDNGFNGMSAYSGHDYSPIILGSRMNQYGETCRGLSADIKSFSSSVTENRQDGYQLELGEVLNWDFTNGQDEVDIAINGAQFTCQDETICSNSNLYTSSQEIISGHTSSVPVFIEKMTNLDGMIFSININNMENPEVSELSFEFTDGVSGQFNYNEAGDISVVLTGLDSYAIGEIINIGNLLIDIPDDILNGQQYALSFNNVSGTDVDYNLIDIIGYQNILLNVITDPPFISLDFDSICMVEGLDSYSSSFAVTDDMNMNIDFTYTCPDYVELTYDSDTDTGILNINPYDGAPSAECILNAVTDDIIPELTQVVIPITINHIPDIGIGSNSFNVVEGQEYTFNLNPYDEDGDIFNISLVEGYPDYVDYNSNDNSITINAPLGSPSNELCFNVTDDGCAEINVEECYDIDINHYPVISCDQEVIHIPEFDSRTIFCSFDDGGDNDLTEPVLTELSYVSTEIVDGGVLLYVNTLDNDQSGTLTITLADNTEENLSDTDEISIVVYETYLSGDVRPQSDSDEAGGFGDGLIVAPDVVNILKVAVGLEDAPDSESDLFDAFDTYPSSQDINGDEDYFDEAERGGDQSIGSSDALAALNMAFSFSESIRMVDNDYPLSTSLENGQREDNRTNDLISLGVIDHEVARGEIVSIPVIIQRGSTDGMSGFAAGFNLVSNNSEQLCDIKFKPTDSDAPTFAVEGNPYGILVYDMNPIPAFTEDYQIGTIDFQVPWDETSTSITLEISSPSGNTSNLDVVHIDIENTNTVLTVNPNYVYQDEYYRRGANLETFNALTDITSLDYMFSSDGIIYNIIGEGVAASFNPVLGWVGSLSNIDKSSAYWVKTNEDIDYEMRGIPTYNNNTQDNSDDWSKDIHYGANLTAYPCLVPSNDIDSAIDSESCFQEGDGIIGEGVAASYNPVLGWVGSLSNFIPGQGYWIKSDCSNNFTFQWECEEPGCISIDELSSRDILTSFDRPEELNYVQSSQQAFYFINELDLRESSIENGDWIVAMYNDNVVGARAWNGLFTDIPVMGYDNSDYSINYIDSGELPTFKLYKDGEMIDLYGSYPEFNNLGIYHIALSDVDLSIPEEFVLEAAYPNPFNPSTTISYGVSEATHMNVSVYNIQGQQVGILYDGFIEPGYYQKTWNASELSSGIYIVRMSTDTGFTSNQKVVLVK